MTHSAWWLTCNALAVYRLAILVTRDTITTPLREWLRRRAWPDRTGVLGPDAALAARADDWRWVYSLATCAWCVSVWAALLVTLLTVEAPLVWQYPCFGLALSAAAGFLAERT